ncbi:iron-containing alcohol dehydrogenase [Mesorhizobium microcysteis]|uniref:Iron-containing alcohol dehydrogenase n=1 Tax=Neoaquamicrobium microcysteis TaxID=2682781 RepID=A0A5D4H5W3_9HYPH|nr:iron-containing alcohol dehydrogenase [Mesorhizobium microcysteis]TYR36451.1 iron-containing alcohol dehydrogenase [Mesorhizobium microcysteis]
MSDMITYLSSIRFGDGAVEALAGDIATLGVKNPLFVTDAGIVAAGLLERAMLAAGRNDAPVFDGTPPNPTAEAVYSALDLYRDAGCDGIVAVGGGSPIDLAKAVALLVNHHEPLERYAVIEGGLARIVNPLPPLIAIPTTAGTGSEVGRGALISFSDGRKLGLISPKLIPSFAICDPEMTLGLPPMQTAATGMDAITHCIETYLSPKFNPPAEAIALDGLKRGVRNIRRAYEDGSDRSARREMMMAALEGGLTFQKGLGSVHALSHPLGGLRDVALHHGMLNAAILPIVLRYCSEAAPDKFAVLRETIGIGPQADLAEYIADLSVSLGLPQTIGQFGVKSDVVPTIAQAAMRDHSHATNVRPMSLVEYERILEEVISGRR